MQTKTGIRHCFMDFNHIPWPAPWRGVSILFDRVDVGFFLCPARQDYAASDLDPRNSLQLDSGFACERQEIRAIGSPINATSEHRLALDLYSVGGWLIV